MAPFRPARFIAAALMLVLSSALSSLPARAGTTGGISGRVLDARTHAPIPGVTVSALAPTQSASAVTDASGAYSFLSLIPDTYTLRFTKPGYEVLTSPGVTVLADQVQTVNVALNAALTTIGSVTTRASGSIVKPGTTSDVYSVNATGVAAAQSLAGPGGLSNAYGAIAAIPGVVVDTGESGWFQQVHIRGGDIDQVGYELDGIPVNRVYDNAPQTMLSTLGQQELQVYTGGTPASADAQGIAGYVNQVIRTGTYPGFGQADLGVGGPAFFHRASVEAGGSTPDRRFTYYVGLSGADQDYNYLDNANGAGASSYFYYPFLLQNASFAGPVYVGGSQPNEFAPGNAFGIANTEQRDSVVNLHYAIPHGVVRDDLQFLYLTSEIFANYYSSVSDLGPGLTGGALPWDDGVVYNGPLLKPVEQNFAQNYYFPSSPPHAFDSLMPTDIRDTNDNGVSISKLQYTHSFNQRSFLRAYGYLMYSNWFIWGPNSSDESYGAELADYEIPDHTFGGNLNYTNQLSEQHLLSISGSFTGADLQRYSNSYVRSDPNVATFMDENHTCYNPSTGMPTLCYDPSAQLGAVEVQSGAIPAAPAGTAAANAGAQFYATSNGIIANLNQVHTRFSSVSITDEYRPSDRNVVNLGLRVENFKYLLSNQAENPTTEFWFSQYNADYCYGPGDTSPQLGSYSAGGTVCPNAGEKTLAALGPAYELSDTVNPSISTTRFEPRLSFTHTINPDTVVRGSFGVYARPQNSSWVEYNTVQSDLPSFLGQHFYAFGFRTPEHDIRPDTSYNTDLSLEKRVHGTDWSFKLTPFYRSTRDQLQNFFIDPLTGLESGLNVGHQVSSGVEVALVKGDFSREGLSGQVGFTYTHSAIRYQDFDGLNYNVIDLLNRYIQQYNSYTKSCAGAAPSTSASSMCGSYGGSNAVPNFAVPNPYYNSPAQPLLADNGWYSTYDVIPGPYSAENGYETPYVATLILNYKRDRLTITPSFLLSSGAKYGAPLAWPGYDPASCTATLPSGAADPASCGVNAQTGLPLFIPDVYTGKFDNLGEFNEPWRFQANLQTSYRISPGIKATLVMTNLVDHCGQRGYAWDQPNVCVYGALPSGILPPAGNYYPNSLAATPPPQLKYPYTFLLNNNNTGFVGTRLPMEFTFNLEFRM